MADFKKSYDLDGDCVICQDTFDAQNKRVYYITCGHSVCSTCSSRLSSKFPTSSICPVCTRTGVFIKIMKNFYETQSMHKVHEVQSDFESQLEGCYEQMIEMTNEFREKEEKLTIQLMAEKDDNVRCAQKLQTKSKDYESVKQAFRDRGVELESAQKEKQSMERTLKQLQEKVKALTSKKLIPRYYCSECNGKEDQDKVRVCLRCCEEKGIISLVESSPTILRPGEVGKLLICRTCALDTHSGHRTSPFFRLMFTHNAMLHYSKIVASMRKIRGDGTLQWEKLVAAGENVVSIIQKRRTKAESLSSETAYNKQRSESEGIIKRYEVILMKLCEDVESAIDEITQLASDQPPAASAKAEDPAVGHVDASPDEELVEWKKLLKSLTRLAKLLPEVARNHLVNIGNIEERIGKIDSSLLLSSAAEIEFDESILRPVTKEEGVRSVCSSIFCDNYKDNSEEDLTFEGGHCDKCCCAWERSTYTVPGFERVFDTVYNSDDISRMNCCESERHRVETARSILQSKAVELEQELFAIRQCLPELAVVLDRNSEKKSSLFREYLLSIAQDTQTAENTSVIQRWRDLQEEYEKDFEDFKEQVGGGVRSAWNSATVRSTIESLEKLRVGGPIITYFIADLELPESLLYADYEPN